MAWVPADAGRGRQPRSRSPTTAGGSRARCRRRPSTTPTRSGCADELRVPRPRRRRGPRRRACPRRAARSSGSIATPARGFASAPAGGSWPTTGRPRAEAGACRRLGRGRRSLLPRQARAPGGARRSSPRSSRSSPAAPRSRPGRRRCTTGSGGARSRPGRVLAVSPPEATGDRARRARGGRRRPPRSPPCSS